MNRSWWRILPVIALGLMTRSGIVGAEDATAMANSRRLLETGRYLLQQGQPEKAARAFEEAIRYLPRELEILYPWGDSLDQTPHGPARDRFRQEVRERVVRAHPDRLEAWLLLGNAWGKLGRWFSALHAWQRARDLDPGNAPAHIALGVAHFKTDRLGKAAAAFRRAVELAPACSQAQLCLAATLARLGDEQDSSAALREAKRLNPLYHQAHFFLGLVFHGLRDRRPVDPFEEYLNLPMEVPEIRLLQEYLPQSGR